MATDSTPNASGCEQCGRLECQRTATKAAYQSAKKWKTKEGLAIYRQRRGEMQRAQMECRPIIDWQAECRRLTALLEASPAPPPGVVEAARALLHVIDWSLKPGDPVTNILPEWEALARALKLDRHKDGSFCTLAAADCRRAHLMRPAPSTTPAPQPSEAVRAAAEEVLHIEACQDSLGSSAPDYDQSPLCLKCNGWMSTDAGTEPTVLCHHCAQEVVRTLAPLLARALLATPTPAKE